MIRRRQIATVAEFEFLSIVRTKGYLLSTLGMPAMVLLYALFAGWLGDLLERQIEGGAQVFGVVDLADALDLRQPQRGALVDLPESLRTAIEARGVQEATLGPISYFTDTVSLGFEDLDSAKAALLAAGVAIAAGVALPLKALAVGSVFFIAAYLFYGTVARVLSWIPFTSPLTVLGRVALDPEGMAWWDLTLSLALLLFSTWVALKLRARLFRIGLLAMGSRPKLREVWRQARLSS